MSKKAVKYSSRFFVLLAAANLDNPHLTNKDVKPDSSLVYTGFKISRKYGKSHERNLLRRRIKGILQNSLRKKYYPLGLIFIPRSGVKELEFNVLEEEMNKALIWCVRKLEL